MPKKKKNNGGRKNKKQPMSKTTVGATTTTITKGEKTMENGSDLQNKTVYPIGYNSGPGHQAIYSKVYSKVHENNSKFYEKCEIPEARAAETSEGLQHLPLTSKMDNMHLDQTKHVVNVTGGFKSYSSVLRTNGENPQSSCGSVRQDESSNQTDAKLGRTNINWDSSTDNWQSASRKTSNSKNGNYESDSDLRSGQSPSKSVGKANNNSSNTHASNGFKTPPAGHQSKSDQGSGRGRGSGIGRGRENLYSVLDSVPVNSPCAVKSSSQCSTNHKASTVADQSEPGIKTGRGRGRGLNNVSHSATPPAFTNQVSIENSRDRRKDLVDAPDTRSNNGTSSVKQISNDSESQKAGVTKRKNAQSSNEDNTCKRYLRSNAEDIKKEEAKNQAYIQKLKELLSVKINNLTIEKLSKSAKALRLTINKKNAKNQSRKDPKGDITSLFCEIIASKKILVTGNPGFGKTILCLEISKTVKYRNDTRKMVFYFTSQEVEDMDSDIARHLVKFYSDLLDIEPSFLEQFFSNYSKDVLVVFEDYDALSFAAKSRVQAFVSKCHSAVIVTSRHVSDKDPLLTHFNTCVTIPGSNLPNLLMRYGDKILLRMYECLLSELPQTFFRCSIKPEDPAPSLFFVLEQEYNFKAQEAANVMKLEEVEKCFLRLGLVFWDALCQGFMSFTEQCLKDIFGEVVFDFLIACEILYLTRGDASNRVYVPRCKLLLVFFATKYLRNIWSKSRTLEQKQHFMQNVLCLKDCTGDYLVGSTSNLYFVGLLPEIVINFGKQFSFDNATVEMYYDNQGTEVSKAFSSLNLLIRLEKKHLPRFSFTELSTDNEELQIVFEAFLNALYLPDITVDYEMYLNEYEGRYYLKVLGKRFDEDTEIVFRSVCRSSLANDIDSSFVEVSLKVLDNVIEFLSKFLKQNFPDLQLSEECGKLSLFEFVSNLIWGVIECTAGPNISISIYGSNLAQVGNISSNIVFFFDPCSKTRLLTVSRFKFTSAKSTVDEDSCKKGGLLQLLASLKVDFDELYDNCNDVKIVIETCRS